MNKKTILILILSICLVSIFAAHVSAADAPGMFDQLFKPFGNVEQAYANYYPLVNMILYLIIFIGLAQWTLGARFGTGGKAMIVGIGIIFAISLALWEKSQDLNIVLAMGPIAMMIFIAIMALAVYEGLTHSNFFGKEHRISAAAIAYFIFFTAITAVGLSGYIAEKFGLAGAIMIIMYFACIIMGIIQLARMLSKKVTGAGGPGAAPAPSSPAASPDAPPATVKEEKQAEKDIAKEEALEERELQELKQVEEDVKKVGEDLRAIAGGNTPETRDAKRKAAKKAVEDIKKHLKKIYRFDKKAERMAVRLRKDLSSAGRNLEAEDVMAINFCEDIKKRIAELEAKCDQMLADLNDPKYTQPSKIYPELQEFWKKLSEFHQRLTQMIALDEKMKKQVAGK